MSQNSPTSLTLTLSAQWVDDYCRDLARRTASTSKRLAALDALNTFVAVATAPGEQARPAFAAIRTTLAQHLELARSALLQESATPLAEALRAQQPGGACALFTALSRDGFWQLLGQVEAMLTPREREQVATWCQQWLAQMMSRAAQHSPYPDAIDFRASGIDLTEYLMVCDLNKFFQR